MAEELDLIEIRNRVENSTPINMWGGKRWDVAESEDGPGATPTYCVGIDGVGHWPVGWIYSLKDAEFIAHARTDIPVLIEIVTRLSTQLAIKDKALEPFAKASADMILSGFQEDEPLMVAYTGEYDACLDCTVGDLHRAAKALSPNTTEAK